MVTPPRSSASGIAARRGGRAEAVHPLDRGFEEFFGYTDAVKAWEKFPKALWDGRKEVAVSGYFDDLITDRAIEFVSHRREEPFFLEVAYTASHFNIDAAGGRDRAVSEQVPRTQPQEARSGHLRRHGRPAGLEHRPFDGPAR